MPNPTYPLDRRILELIIHDLGMESKVCLDAESKASSSTYDEIAIIIANKAWAYMSRPGDKRTKEYDPLDRITWERIFGQLSSKSKCSIRTLQQIAHALEYRNWDDLMKCIEDDYHNIIERGIGRGHYASRISVSSNNRCHNIIEGDKVDLIWDKYHKGIARAELTYLGNNRYRVDDRENCKLEPGDEFICEDHMLTSLHFTNLIRGGESIGKYYGEGMLKRIIIHRNGKLIK
jgi:hypothetical protein